MFKKVLVATRGEIAVRIIRTLKEMNVSSVAVYTKADYAGMFVRLADESVCIGQDRANDSYLSIPALITAAKITGADAVHPGYGFLSESADFSRACRDNGLVFIGPSPEAINMIGLKTSARELAQKAGIPVADGTSAMEASKLLKEAGKIGFPLMIKASSGGGGKGIRVVRTQEELGKEIYVASTEAAASYGKSLMFLEKYIEKPRHIELQFVRGLNGKTIVFPERECSIQRHYQKLLEGTPSPGVDDALRLKLKAAVEKLTRLADYVGIGTAEFLLDRNGKYYFMEVNSRLQVEHTITEEVTGFDLVKEQIFAVAGEKFSAPDCPKPYGHAFEFRINAEDPDNNFVPCAGTIKQWIPPGGPGVRVDTHVYPGYKLPIFYDSMLAKLIIWAPTRAEAVARAKRALGEFFIDGVKTTIPLHMKIVSDKDFAAGNTDTSFLERLIK